jgi:hypothetical protein
MRYISAVCVVLLSLIIFGCGSSSSSQTNSNTAVATNVNPANTASIVPDRPTNGTTIDANAANSANVNQAQVKVVKPSTNVKPMTYPAPDDSEYSSSMDKSGQAIETRIFHKDPLIVKVEKVWKGVSDQTVNIYLKSGKVVKLPGNKWPDIKSKPVQSFYEAAGVTPPSPVTTGTPAVRKTEKPKQ